MSKLKKEPTNRVEQIQAEIRELQQKRATRAKMPTEEELKNWSRNDIQAALSFLHLILDDEEVFNTLVHELYQKHAEAEQKFIELTEQQIQTLEQELNGSGNS